MLNQKQFQRMLEKQKKYLDRIGDKIFDMVDTVEVTGFETSDKYAKAPEDVSYKQMLPGDHWGREKSYCWFKVEYLVPERLDGQKLYIYPEYDGYEALLFVNGLPYANFASKYPAMNTSHGNHYCKVFTQSAKAGERYELMLEAYAGHDIEGCMTYDPPIRRDYTRTLGQFKIMVKNQLYSDFYYDMKTLVELYEALSENSIRKAELQRLFLKLNEELYFSDRDTGSEIQNESIKLALSMMKPLLNKNNSETTARVGILGHSHMDTAWLWEIDETIKKCARTFANQINLMEQYPDYHFIQSSAAHLKFIEEYYPNLFSEIKERILEGRYEPNGGVWIECDCNITGGEFLVRQFLWGQNYTIRKFGYQSNAFFLPDTFGYSAAIPQILKQCGIDYFLTTKMEWNDTNKFPYDTYYWQGIDGSRVLAHHNVIHCHPTPAKVIGIIDSLSQKAVSCERLMTYGFGDGGGGPEDYSLEMASRLNNLDGCPPVYNTTVGGFMQNLEKNLTSPDTHTGELYLELHRGTLTNQHTIKRNNRKAEIAIRNAEYFTCLKALNENKTVSDKEISPLVETLLTNQFHDILPGTCIPEVHDRSIRETTEVIRKAEEIAGKILANGNDKEIVLYNTLSLRRDDTIEIDTDWYLDADCTQQMVTKLNGQRVLCVSGIGLAGFESRTYALTDSIKESKSPFKYNNRILETPFARIRFDDNGYISSFIDLNNGRELRGGGYSLNTLLYGEDLSLAWDNWDIDADAEMKLSDCAVLKRFEVVSDGAVEFRIRTAYGISDKTTLNQDIIFYAQSPRVDFETLIDWNDKHRLLKAVFDTTINTDYATSEIQYGNVRRTTGRNNVYEQAQFEVCNHKYTDLSEPRCGVALLNDCKYGISVHGRSMALTLHKGGCKPDPRGDKGVHEFKYAFFPHNGGFCAEDTISQGYLFNYPVISCIGGLAMPVLLSVSASNVIVEAIKPCEDNQKAMIVRMYEAEGSYSDTQVTFNEKIKAVTETDLLEREIGNIDIHNHSLVFNPFQIRSFKLSF